ncbi:hypothetical protein QJS10_CPB17g01933 [Acorus calamus]|uniref:Uncharacterized protein n=1 Tax=Acorus calamus TaxID=4465 RepID=A0AAV9CT47_ACOCL|nr:hypothetical protein QJS10_CPB17g01933 [Acorus calamus]
MEEERLSSCSYLYMGRISSDWMLHNAHGLPEWNHACAPARETSAVAWIAKKIAQLNFAIDDVSSQLHVDESLNGVPVASGEVEYLKLG